MPASLTLAQSGDVATWAGSIGTLLAFVVALVLFALAVTDRRKAQARLVSGYLSSGLVKHLAGAIHVVDNDANCSAPGGLLVPESPGNPKSAFRLTADAISLAWVVRNESDEMLGRIRLILVDDHGNESTQLMARGYMLSKEVLEQTVFMKVSDAPRSGLRPKVIFEDSVGRCWERAPGSPLRRIRKRKAEAILNVPDPVAGVWVPVDPSTPHIRRYEAR